MFLKYINRQESNKEESIISIATEIFDKEYVYKWDSQKLNMEGIIFNMEKNKQNVRKGIIIGCMVSAAILVGILGSYAYFISAGNNNQNQSANVQTGNIALTFSDGTNSFQGSLEFGSSATKSFTIENTGTLETKVKISWLDLINTYLKESLTYTLSYSEIEDGEYTEILTNKNVPRSERPVTKTLANNLTIPVGKTYYYKLVITLNYLEDIDQTADLKAMLSTEFILEEYRDDPSIGIVPKMVNAIINGDELPESSIKEGNPTFANIATTDETANGLYAMEDDYGTSYYYRGAVANNYVKFGDFYWRIIRVNGDGSLRMIYDGTRAHANGTNDKNRLALTNIAYNPNWNDAKYVGYMYGPVGTTASTSKEQAQTNTESSNIKIQLESWYKTNIADKGLDGYVADSIFCNDRSTPGKSATGWSYDTGLGYGEQYTAYGATARLGVEAINYDKVQPKFTCENKNDAFTKEDTEKGNGALSEKVGLIAADEVVAAGSGKYNTNNTNYYLYKGSSYWSLSPSYLDTGHMASVFLVNNIIYGNGVNYYLGGVAPVINLSAEYVLQMIGDGTIGNEYRLGPDSFSRSQ